MDALKLAQSLIGPFVRMAETIHPLGKSGQAKLSTVLTMTQTALGLAVATGAISGSAAQAVDIIGEINAAVAAANDKGGVPLIEGVSK